MKMLQDLKQELLDNKINRVYVFYGEDFGLRKHYINKIRETYPRVTVLDEASQLGRNSMSDTLFVIPTLFIIYNDIDFAKQSKGVIQTFISKIGKDKVVVLDYETLPETCTLYKEFEHLVTNFPCVKDNVAYEFVDSEIKLDLSSKEELAFNCGNNYSNILLESDKVKSYGGGQLSPQTAYNELKANGQLLYRWDNLDIDLMMNDLLQVKKENYDYWLSMLNTAYPEAFWIMLSRILNDLLIAYLIKRYGKYEGSSKAYELGLPWGRAKAIRELTIPFEASYLLYVANELSLLDYEVKTGKKQQDGIFSYFVCMFMSL